MTDDKLSATDLFSTLAGQSENSAVFIRVRGFDALDQARDQIDPSTRNVHSADLLFEESGHHSYSADKPLRAFGRIRGWTNYAIETARHKWSYDLGRPPTARFAEGEGVEILDDTKRAWPENHLE